LELLVLLMAGPETVSGLADLVELDLPMVSVHLSALRAAGLVVSETRRNLRIQSLSSAVAIRKIEGQVCLRIEVPDGFPVMIEIPRAILDRVHPGFIVEDRPPIPVGLPVVVMPGRERDGVLDGATVFGRDRLRGDGSERSGGPRVSDGIGWCDDFGPAI
jgi:DNA-binding transcriptional ArsR family regulator